MLELIGLGLSLHLERSGRRELAWQCQRQPLTRDISAFAISQEMSLPAEAAWCFWATESATRGVWPFQQLWSRIVLVAEIDKRCAAFAPTGKNPWITRRSSFFARKHQKGERAPEADSTVAKPRLRWRASSEALIDGRRSGLNKPFSLTKRRWKQS